MNAAWKAFLGGLGVVVTAQLCGQAIGCIGTEPKTPDEKALIEKCTAQARVDYQDGYSVTETMRRYDLCMLDGGS